MQLQGNYAGSCPEAAIRSGAAESDVHTFGMW
jgi:hypothetical protein